MKSNQTGSHCVLLMVESWRPAFPSIGSAYWKLWWQTSEQLSDQSHCHQKLQLHNLSASKIIHLELNNLHIFLHRHEGEGGIDSVVWRSCWRSSPCLVSVDSQRVPLSLPDLRPFIRHPRSRNPPGKKCDVSSKTYDLLSFHQKEVKLSGALALWLNDLVI